MKHSCFDQCIISKVEALQTGLPTFCILGGGLTPVLQFKTNSNTVIGYFHLLPKILKGILFIFGELQATASHTHTHAREGWGGDLLSGWK